MPRVDSAFLGRTLLYTALAAGLVAVLAGGRFGLLSQEAPAAATLPPSLRSAQQVVLKTYLASARPTPPETLVAAALDALPDDQLASVIDWMSVAPDKRPAALFDTRLPRQSPLFPHLLTAALTGRQSPPLDPQATQRLLESLPLEPADPLLLTIIENVAQHAASANPAPPPVLRIALLARAARHPAAHWQQVETLAQAALDTRVTQPAASFLQDWLDAPPAQHLPEQRRAVLCHLASLHLLDNQPAAAWARLAPVIAEATQKEQPLDQPTLDLAWTVATLAGTEGKLAPLIDAHLGSHLHHQRHWRELGSLPTAAPDYLIGLHRLARACLASGDQSRLIAVHLHLASLDDPNHLLPILPLATRLQRLNELLACIDLLEQSPEAASTPPLLHTLALACLERGDSASAASLVQHRLRSHPQDPDAARIRVQIDTHNLPPMQSAMHWARHLRRHPEDIAARHLGLDSWLRAGQPHAAVNQLLATPPQQLDPALRLRTTELALENGQTTALITAVERLLAQRDAIPSALAAPLQVRLRHLGRPDLADTLTPASVEIRRALPATDDPAKL